MTLTISRLAAYARAVVLRFDDDRCMQTAASLTFTTLLSIVPLITVALTLISAFPVFATLTDALESHVLQNMLPESAEAVTAYADQFAANAAKLTAVGIVFLGVTALTLMLTIDRAFNEIWRVRRPRPLLQRVIVYWMLLTVGPVLVGASISATSWLVTHSLGLVSDIPGAGVALLKTAPVLLTAAALGLLYLAMPNRRIAARDALIGGLLAGIMFEVMKRAFAWYVTQFPTYQMVYGAFATIPVFLLWVYLSWLVVLFGAVAVAVLPEWRERSTDSRRVPGADFQCALQILKILWQAHGKGAAVSLAQIHRVVRANMERIEGLLESMADAAWASRTASGGWILARDPGSITLDEVYRRFVFEGGACPAAPEIEGVAAQLSSRMSDTLQTSVEDLFRSAAAAPRASA